MENKILYPLFDIESIIDYPMTVAKMIRDKYFNSKYFLNLEDEYWLKCMFSIMKTKDPIPLLVTDKYVDRCEGLYKEFLEEKDISDYYTDHILANAVEIFNLNGFTISTIMVNNDNEAEFIKKRFNDQCKIIKYKNPININGKYGAYYTNDVNYILSKLVDPMYIVFKVAKFKYNLEDKEGFDLLKLEVLKNVDKSNRFKFFEPYNDIQIPKEE